MIKATHHQSSPLAARMLRLFGVVVLVSSLIDYGVLLVPFNFLDRQWQLSSTNQLVDRGIIPIVGLAFLFTGFWIDRVSGALPANPGAWRVVRLFALGVSSLLGLVFLLVVPLHLNNNQLANEQALKQISQEATQAETQVDSQVAAGIDQERSRINLLLSNKQELDTAIKSGQVPKEQVSLLRQFQADPAAIDKFLNQQAKVLRPQAQNQIRDRKLQLEQQTKTSGIKSALRIIMSSLLLAVAYITFSWTGLKETWHL